MSAIGIVWFLSLCVIVTTLLLVFFAFVRIVISRFRPIPLFTNRTELLVLSASLIAAVIGSVWLFFGPGYMGTTYTVIQSSNGSVARSVVENSRSFYEVNDRSMIFLFVVPVLFALLPFLFYRSRARPIVQGVCAFFLSIQAAIGMSGYGLLFMPSGFLMVIATIVALQEHAAHPGVSTDVLTDDSQR